MWSNKQGVRTGITIRSGSWGRPCDETSGAVWAPWSLMSHQHHADCLFPLWPGLLMNSSFILFSYINRHWPSIKTIFSFTAVYSFFLTIHSKYAFYVMIKFVCMCKHTNTCVCTHTYKHVWTERITIHILTGRNHAQLFIYGPNLSTALGGWISLPHYSGENIIILEWIGCFLKIK